jgi:hypothetical protein
MTEPDWLYSNDPVALLNHLRGKVSDRKLRLFSISQADALPRERSEQQRWQQFRLVAEAFAETGCGRAERHFERAGQQAFADIDYGWTGFLEGHDISWWRDFAGPTELEQWAGRDAAYFCSEQLPRDDGADHPAWEAASQIIRLVLELAVRKAGYRQMVALGLQPADGEDGFDFGDRLTAAVRPEAEPPARAALCRALREVVGNPFRPPKVEPGWASWNGGAITQIARTIYEERAFDQLPILADGLEEAGCSDATLLHHCRESEGHVRGCWALDLILGLLSSD